MFFLFPRISFHHTDKQHSSLTPRYTPIHISFSRCCSYRLVSRFFSAIPPPFFSCSVCFLCIRALRNHLTTKIQTCEYTAGNSAPASILPFFPSSRPRPSQDGKFVYWEKDHYFLMPRHYFSQFMEFPSFKLFSSQTGVLSSEIASFTIGPKNYISSRL